MNTAIIAALRAHAAGLYPEEVGAELLIRHGGILPCDDFAGFVHTGTSIGDGTTLMAWIDWDAALSALHDGTDPLFPTRRGTRLSRDVVERLLAKHAASAAIVGRASGRVAGVGDDSGRRAGGDPRGGCQVRVGQDPGACGRVGARLVASRDVYGCGCARRAGPVIAVFVSMFHTHRAVAGQRLGAAITRVLPLMMAGRPAGSRPQFRRNLSC